MSYILPDMSRFTQAIASMQLATPDECKRLEYSLPKTSLVWDGEAFPNDSSGYVRTRWSRTPKGCLTKQGMPSSHLRTKRELGMRSRRMKTKDRSGGEHHGK